ncbi:hypothetical protein B9T25_12990 [Acinetobacter sp. ANC 4470]|uniref:Arc family DNA-binding protein n=1 Tax=Acinetobacter sp. ANC 4470 TaxID=1977881 RepID=UPI000A339D29|nr:Arc family DNA-binding protein [Acinetobacter sp. ANC 4470]OTG64350.1 hypothetical protein B9T25_12990 [Acinetobacter sp. ANC 4470]
MSEDQSSVVTLKVRVTPEFREKIVETAKANNRSMNQEIVSRLEHTFNEDKGYVFKVDTIEEHLRKMKQEIIDVINDSKKAP